MRTLKIISKKTHACDADSFKAAMQLAEAGKTALYKASTMFKAAMKEAKDSNDTKRYANARYNVRTCSTAALMIDDDLLE